MDQAIQITFTYLLNVGIATGYQLILLFLPTIVLAMIMHFISEATQKTGYKLMGDRLFLGIFGWLGTAVHELGHAFFALIFFHKITGMKLFSLNAKKGTLGYVSHTWNSSNPIQTMGNFFIGIGPIILGSLMLFIITYLLFFTSTFQIPLSPVTVESFSSPGSVQNLFSELGHGLKIYFTIILSGSTTTWWKIIIFFYLIFSIGSSISLSMEDIKGAAKGFLIFILLLVCFNLLTLWIGNFTTEFIRYISSFFSAFYFLIILSILLNLIFLILLLSLTGIKAWLIRKSEQK